VHAETTRARRLLLGLIVPALLVAAWGIGSRAGVLSADGFSRPSAVVAALVETLARGPLIEQTWETLSTALIGCALAAGLGIGLGALIGLLPPLERMVGPTVEALRPVPSVALIPIALLVFGFGLAMGVSIVAFAAFWPILILTAAAVRGVDPRLDEVGRALGLSLPKRLWKLVLPAALPGIAMGLRTAFGIALVVAVTVEIAANPRGLGYAMILAQQSLRTDLMYANLVWLGLLGWALNLVLFRVERRALTWFWIARSRS
jgi:ABC-type nitrate/sulfonate/bicarbonate transport system permease component